MSKEEDKQENVKRAENYINNMISTMMTISAVLATICVAILAIIARSKPSLINLTITFFVLISVVIFILSFRQGIRSHGILILALLKGEKSGAEKARLPTLKYYRILSLGLVSLGIACALFFVNILIDLPLLKSSGITEKIAMMPFSYKILNSFAFVFILIGLLGQIGFVRKFPSSTNIKDLQLSPERLLRLNGYQVWKWSWILILVGSIVQLIRIWII